MGLPRSLRLRLTIAFVVLGAVVITVAAFGVSALLGQTVWRPVDATLEEETDQLAAILLRDEGTVSRRDVVRTGDEDLLAAVTQIGAERDLGEAKFVEVTDVSGNVLAAYGTGPVDDLHHESETGTSRRCEFVVEKGRTYRIAHLNVRDVGRVSIGVRADRHIHSLSRARIALALGALGFLLTLGAIAWQIAMRATREIDDVAADLEALEADSLDRRLNRGGTAEVDRLVAALNRMLARLDQAVSHLHRFTADAAHELRTPLAALRTRIDGALGSEPTVDAFRDGLLDALEQTERLTALAEDLLTLSAVDASESLAHEDVSVGDLVEEVAAFFKPVAEEQGRTLVVTAASGAVVRGSARLLKRVLINLVDNAFRHTPASSQVSLECRKLGDRIRVVVRDAGPGFEVNESRLFRRFARGGSEHAGTDSDSHSATRSSENMAARSALVVPSIWVPPCPSMLPRSASSIPRPEPRSRLRMLLRLILAAAVLASACTSRPQGEDHRRTVGSRVDEAGRVVLTRSERGALGLESIMATDGLLTTSTLRFGKVVARPQEDALVTAPLTGRLIAPTLSLGATVSQGDVLVTLEPLVDTASRATLEAQRRELQGQIEGARAQVEAKRADLARVATLVSSGLATPRRARQPARGTRAEVQRSTADIGRQKSLLKNVRDAVAALGADRSPYSDTGAIGGGPVLGDLRQAAETINAALAKLAPARAVEFGIAPGAFQKKDE